MSLYIAYITYFAGLATDVPFEARALDQVPGSIRRTVNDYMITKILLPVYNNAPLLL